MAILSREELLVRFGLKPAPVVVTTVVKVEAKEKKTDKKVAVLIDPSPEALAKYEEIVSTKTEEVEAPLAVETIGTSMTPQEIEALLQPASLDLVIGHHAALGRTNGASAPGGMFFGQKEPRHLGVKEHIDALLSPAFVVEEEGSLPLHPGQRALVLSKHWFTIPSDLAVEVRTRSTTKRLGIDMVGSAGYIDPGFSGYITLEPVNENQVPVLLPLGVPVAQLVFHQLSAPSEGYSGYYTRKEIPEGDAVTETMFPKPLR